MYPDLATLRTLEKETLKRIVQIGAFGKLGELREAANDAEKLINDRAGSVDVHLGFTLDIRLRGDRGGMPAPRRIDLGALVAPAPDRKTVSHASYSLLICKSTEPAKSPIVRKMHFDYESILFRNMSEPKPSAHLQICGKLSPGHKAAGYTDERIQGMYPSWEKPRIPQPPTSLALMLNLLLLEFQNDPVSQGILSSPGWRTWVAHAERTMLLPYFKEAVTFLQSTADKKKRFLQTCLYCMSGD